MTRRRRFNKLLGALQSCYLDLAEPACLFSTRVQRCIFRSGLDYGRRRIFKFQNPLTLGLGTHLGVLRKKIRGLGNHLQVRV